MCLFRFWSGGLESLLRAEQRLTVRSNDKSCMILEVGCGRRLRGTHFKVPTKVDADGVIRMYDPTTNTFGAYGPDGITRSYFKPNPAEHGLPSNWDYRVDQPGLELFL